MNIMLIQSWKVIGYRWDTFQVNADIPTDASSYSMKAKVPYVNAVAGCKHAAKMVPRDGLLDDRPT
jgi:hypothetical protein